MADTVIQVLVSPFLGLLFDNLKSLIQREFGLIWGVNEEMEKLSNTLSTIQDVLEDAEVKQIKDKAIQNWLRKLKEAAYDAEDVLDEFATEASTPESEIVQTETSNNIQVCNSVLSCFDLKRIRCRRAIAKRTKEITKKFDEIATERSKFHLREGIVERGVQFSPSRETSSFPTEPQVYGRDEDKEKIIELLLENVSSKEDVSVFPMVGIGGLGKTTLAQLVYNDERIKKHFEVKIWVCVSEDFEVKRITKMIIESSSKTACSLVDLDPMQLRLGEILNGKRFLLVLDDVWNENQEKWDRLKYTLTCGAKGSSIVVTTRLETVASIMGTLPTYHLAPLSEDDCWSLFKRHAFGVDEEVHINLVAIGKEIVKKCGGVPLAAKALGSLMRFKRNESEWLFVRDNEIWDLGKEDTILPALRLSYDRLPSHLRQCFAYCSIFPKDYVMKKDELIHLWMANSFIQPKGELELEDIGNEIFNDLLRRSFFQGVKTDADGNTVKCVMHDLLHDLACSIMANECSFMELGKAKNVGRSTRHLSLIFDSEQSSAHLESLSIRTLLLLKIRLVYEIKLTIVKLKQLRVLSLNHMDIANLPVSFGNLRHLRYLNFSCCVYITSLPESFCSLRNLQTLKLKDCYSLQMLPENMRKLRSLRHLDIRGCYLLTRMPVGMGQLVCLQTLSIFLVGLENGGCGIRELQGLNHLRGELVIKGLEHVRNVIDAKNANLMRKKNLRSLGLYWPQNFQFRENNSNDEEEAVAEGLQPHLYLKRLEIVGYGGVKFPRWFMLLQNLVQISLDNCGRCERLPSLGQLPLLKVLKISRMDSVKIIGNEFYYGEEGILEGLLVSFPSLEELRFQRMPNLEKWRINSISSSSSSSEVQVLVLPCLRALTINGCPKLTTCPPFPSSLKYLWLCGCNEMILRSLKYLPPCLSSLRIEEFGELISFPEEGLMMLRNLTALQSLDIKYCPKLKMLPSELLENLTALTNLSIWRCGELISFPEEMQNLTSLKSFEIDRCDSLESLPEMGRNNTLINLFIQHCGITSLSEGLRHLTTLKSLRIKECKELEFFPEDFEHLISLVRLQFGSLPNLASLPAGLQHVTALENLEVWDCSGFTTLPEWISNFRSLQTLEILGCKNLKFLPEGLQHLTALRTLKIKECHPDLHRRCEKERGDDWYKIAHIPNLMLQTETSGSSSS